MELIRFLSLACKLKEHTDPHVEKLSGHISSQHKKKYSNSYYFGFVGRIPCI